MVAPGNNTRAREYGGADTRVEGNGASAVIASDLDGDVLATSRWDGELAWYENLGSGAFGPQIVIAWYENLGAASSVAPSGRPWLAGGMNNFTDAVSVTLQ